MSDQRIEKYADILVNYSAEVRPGDLVGIFTSPEAEPMALAVYRQVLKAGANPIFSMAPGRTAEMLLKHGSEQQIAFTNPLDQWLMAHIDVRIGIRAALNTKALSRIDPKRAQLANKARGPIMETFMQRQASGELRWVVTDFPTHAAAQDAEMSLSDYEDFVYGTAMVDLDDPLAYWRAKAAEQQRYVDYLKGKQHLAVKGENIDLRLSIAGRTFINADGRKNFPDGEIFTGPVEDSVEGWVRFTYPAVYGGREVDGAELRFEQGKVVQATARKGEEYLNSVLDTDPGARYLGEFAIGTNEFIKEFTRNILFDEKIGGTVHMAVGASYPDTGGRNKSDVHWDMICDMRSGGEISADGEVFYRDGKFLI